jgi:hypothetical protein
VKPITDMPGDTPTWPLRSARGAASIAADIRTGELVYAERASCPTRRYRADRVQAPGLAELTAALAARGLALVPEAPFYWRCVAVQPSSEQAAEQVDQARGAGATP